MKAQVPAKVERNLGEYGEGTVLPLKPGKNGNFLVTVGFGTPKCDFTLLFDTGSEKTWIQCQSCSGAGTDCNNQAIFNPSSSSTFSNLTCTSNCTSSNTYNDDSSFTGYYVKDTLTMMSDSFPDLTFTCADKVTGGFEGASGIFAVGQGEKSLLAQTNNNLFSSFCYCLPSSEASSGYITFGVQAFETCQPETEKFIQIEPSNQIGVAYYISLVAITIGPKRLEIASYVPSSVRAMIDSGTIISRLPPSLYSAFSSVFQEIMSQYPRTTPPEKLFDTCYNLEGHINDWRPPSIVLHFGSPDALVDVALDSSAATISWKNESEVCLAFAGNESDDELFIIGNQQHRARNLFFDTSSQMLYFSSGSCLSV
ncbi:Eukaryotic aspartyl protease family protein [Euphorbia peplus]|nr:Eukaryotic aspartyl protease family protein [Euphorbia peplus]